MTNKPLTGRKSVGKKGITVFLAICCIICLCACSDGSSSGETSGISKEQRKKRVKVHNAIVKILDFDIDDEYLEETEISTGSLTSDTFGNVKIRVKTGKEEELLNVLQKKCGNYQIVAPNNVPGYQDHQYAYELKQMQNIRNFEISKSGKTVKSDPVNIYIANQGNDTYLFIFG